MPCVYRSVIDRFRDNQTRAVNDGTWPVAYADWSTGVIANQPFPSRRIQATEIVSSQMAAIQLAKVEKVGAIGVLPASVYEILGSSG